MKRQAVKKTAYAKILPLAIAFSKKWENAKSEIQKSQSFLKEFLGIFGIEFIPSGQFEYRVQKGNGESGRIDYLLKVIDLLVMLSAFLKSHQTLDNIVKNYINSIRILTRSRLRWN